MLVPKSNPKPTEPNAPFFVDTEVIRLTKNGIWLSDEIEIDHGQTVKMFAKSLRRDGEGYFLQIGRETKRITVEDTAYFITRIEGTPERGFDICLNDETRERLNPATLVYRPGRLTCKIKRGTEGTLMTEEEAKFLHAAYFDLLKGLEEDGSCYWLTIANQKIVLASK